MLLRIDDTDPERSKTEFEENIKKDLNWLGVFWENTDLQSLRIDKYNNAAQPLYIIIDSDENILSGPIGYCSEDEFYQFLKDGIDQ